MKDTEYDTYSFHTRILTTNPVINGNEKFQCKNIKHSNKHTWIAYKLTKKTRFVRSHLDARTLIK